MIKDLHKDDFRSLLHQAVDIVLELYEDVVDKPVYQARDQQEIEHLFRESLPESATALDTLLETIQQDVIPNVALHYSPNFYAWVTSNATQASIVGELIATALNVNATTWLNAPAASELEQRVIRWIVEFIQYAPDANGVLLSGGSLSNFTGLRVAIAQKCPYDFQQQGHDQNRPLRVYTSTQTHFCMDRAMVSLGLGMENLVKIKVNQDFTINLIELEKQIETDLAMGRIPIAVVGNAGTVNSGAIDPIAELHTICRKYNLWLHLDAAYGGFAASVPALRTKQFKGLELADSVSIDLHKWLFVPFECGALLVKNPTHLQNTFSYIPEYQRFEHQDQRVDFSEYSMQQSRSFKALNVWLNFKAYGAENLRQSIGCSIALMQELGAQLRAADDFELVTPVNLSVVCFRYLSPNKNLDQNTLDSINLQLVQATETDGRVFIRETKLHGKVVLRACCTNFRRRAEDIQWLLTVLRELGLQVYRNHGNTHSS